MEEWRNGGKGDRGEKKKEVEAVTLPRFEYLAPKTIEEACRLLKERGEDAKVMAGGTDLLIKLRHRSLKPRTVVGLKGIPDLGKIVFDEKRGLTIGAMALLAEVAFHPDILKVYPAVACAAQATGNVQVRNMGTVVGNLCNAAPSADNAPVFLVMGAELVITGPDRRRVLPLDRFFKGPGLIALEPGEIVTSISVPPPPIHSGVSYQHLSARGEVDISAVSVAAMVVMDAGTCQDARIALGAVAPVPLRATKSERLLKGKKLTPTLMEKVGSEAMKEASPISDVRASAEYRLRMISVLTRRALAEAGERAIKI